MQKVRAKPKKVVPPGNEYKRPDMGIFAPDDAPAKSAPSEKFGGFAGGDSSLAPTGLKNGGKPRQSAKGASTSSVDLFGGYSETPVASQARPNNVLGLSANTQSADIFGGYEVNSNPYEGQRVHVAGPLGAGQKQTFDIGATYDARQVYESERKHIAGTGGNGHAHSEIFGGYEVNSNPYEGQRSMNAGVKGAGMKQTFDIYGAYEERSNPYEGQRMAIGATSATAHAHKDLWGGYEERSNPYEGQRKSIGIHTAQAAASSIDLGGGYENPTFVQPRANNALGRSANASTLNLGGGYENPTFKPPKAGAHGKHATSGSFAGFGGGGADDEKDGVLASLNQAHDILLFGADQPVQHRDMKGSHGRNAADSTIQLGGGYNEPLHEVGEIGKKKPAKPSKPSAASSKRGA